jgi:hypothetical protein
VPYTIELINGGTGILCCGQGLTTAREVRDATSAAASWGPLISRITHAVIDLSAVSTLEISAVELRWILEADRRLAQVIPRLHMAIVAPRDVVFGIARMYEAYGPAPGWDVNVFRTAEEAAGWLNSVLPDADDERDCATGA